MKTLFILLWLVFGGIWMGIGWWIAGLVMVVTVVGIPWAKDCFVIGQFAFWPFGPAWQPASALATACVLGIVAGLATGGAETLDADTLGDEIGLLALGPQYQLPTYQMEDAP